MSGVWSMTLLVLVLVGVLPATVNTAQADNCATHFTHVGKQHTDTVSGGWLWCGIATDGCVPISSVLSHADAEAFRTLLDSIGRRSTPASRATYNDVPFKTLLDVIQPNHTC